MNDGDFIDYIGDYRVHDGRIAKVITDGDKVRVTIKSIDGEDLWFEFYEVKTIEGINPEGMLLYAVSEVKTEEPFRTFYFINWHEEREEYLSVIAKYFKYTE